MKIAWSVLFILLLSPKSFADIPADSPDSNGFPEPKIVDVDSAKSEITEAAQMPTSEDDQAKLKAEANEYARKFRLAQAQEKSEAARAHRETTKTKNLGRVYQKQTREALYRTAIAERKIQQSRQIIAKAQQRRETLLNQKLAADKKLKAIVAKSKASQQAVRQANLSVKSALNQARISKRQMQLAQLRYNKTQRQARLQIQRAKSQVAKYNANSMKYKKAKRSLDDKSMAMLSEE